jgi:hypothetical protein
MATKKTPGTTTGSISRAASKAGTSKRRTTTRRRTSSALQPRRRPSRPGLPTTVGTALGTLVVTTLLDLSWPARIGLVAIVLVVGLAYVVWKNRAEVAPSSPTEVAPSSATEDAPSTPVAPADPEQHPHDGGGAAGP